jgi:hypothetical protein
LNFLNYDLDLILDNNIKMNSFHFSSLFLVIALALIHQAYSDLSVGCKRIHIESGLRTKCRYFDSAEFHFLTERCPPPRDLHAEPRQLSFCVKKGTCPQNTPDADIYAKFEKLITHDCPLTPRQQKEANRTL